MCENDVEGQVEAVSFNGRDSLDGDDLMDLVGQSPVFILDDL